MPADVVIRAEGLGKKYLIGHARNGGRGTLRDAVVQAAAGFGRSLADMMRGRAIVAGDSVEELWALKEVNFEVRRGEVVGIIGRNGAGKSTLLKILSRITDPTEGEIAIKGRVASLLEVGTGFHPELTGRENIYLNGAILGMTRAEIRRKFDEIVDFSGVEKFLDTPVKRYSSGMYVRLAFAVAAHLEPEILIVDEVLAVGDAEFQKKCLGKMGDVAAGGRTVLLVSHNMLAIKTLASRSLLLDEGRVKFAGDVSVAIETYLSEPPIPSKSADNCAQGNEYVKLLHIKIVGAQTGLDRISINRQFLIEICYEVYRPLPNFYVLIHFVNRQGVVIFTAWPPPSMHQSGRYISTCQIPENLLNEDVYFLNMHFSQDANKLLTIESAFSFSIVDDAERNIPWYGREPGFIRPTLAWTTARYGE